MSTNRSNEAIPPSVARLLARRDREAEQERETKARDERWPMSLDVRGVVVKLALEMTGLEVRAEGDVAPIVPTEKDPLPPPRIRLSAMRILATCDRLALEQKKFDLQDHPSGDDDEPLTPGEVFTTLKMTPNVADKVFELLEEQYLRPRPRPRQPVVQPAPARSEVDAEPEPSPAPAEALPETVVPASSAEAPPGSLRVEVARSREEGADRSGQHSGAEPGNERNTVVADRPSNAFRDRWPITKTMRLHIIKSALGLCGYAIAPEGRVEAIPQTDETPKPKRRIVLGALRILTRFDRLSIMEQKLKRRFKPPGPRKNPAPDITWAFVGLVCDLIEEDERDQVVPGYAERCEAAFEANRIARADPMPWWMKKREGQRP